MWIEQHKIEIRDMPRTYLRQTATDFSRFAGVERRPAKAEKREMLLPGSSASRLPVVAERGAISFAQSGEQRDEPPFSHLGKTAVVGHFELLRSLASASAASRRH